MIKKVSISLLAAVLLASSYAGIASAHVAVKPAEAETATFQNFTTSVPNEKELATVKVRVVVPQGLKYVTPNVKPGWTITTVKDGEGETAKVKEITWSDGIIPIGQRDEFVFSAQLPAEPTTLKWKAYQTYEDGTEVAWDQAPATNNKDDEEATPYSETKVVKDLGQAAAASTEAPNDGRISLASTLAVIATIISVYTLTRTTRTTRSTKDNKN